MAELFDGNLAEMYSGLFARVNPSDFPLLEKLQELCKSDRLRTVFQPIFRATSGRLEGCEALIRFPDEAGFKSPVEAFSESARVGLLLALESAATARHLLDVRGHIGSKWLFINLSAPLFSDSRFGAAWFLEQALEANLYPGQIVLEIPELLRIRDTLKFMRYLEPFRREGFRIAIDDFGAGYTNLRMIVDLSPDFVKVDRVFIDGIASHARKRILVESVVTLCHRVSCQVIAEGIELPSDLETCLAAGVDYLQGFLFAHPTDAASAFTFPALKLPARPPVAHEDAVSRLVLDEPPLAPESTSKTIAARFEGHPRLRALPVVGEGTLLGLVRRPPLDSDVVAPLEPMDTIAETASVEEAASLVTRRPEPRRFDPIVVVGTDGSYRGFLEVDDLVMDLARQKQALSQQVHPLTGLPGRIVFERALSRRLEHRTPVGVARINLRRFKLFNERYGFPRGDDLLHQVAGLLRERYARLPGSLIAHLDADDFAALSPVEGTLDAAGSVMEGFEDTVRSLHDPEDAAAGGLVVMDRTGEPHKVPLVGVAIGVVLVGDLDEVGVRTVMEAADLTLRGAKQGGESALLLNRRDLKTANRLTVGPDRREGTIGGTATLPAVDGESPER